MPWQAGSYSKGNSGTGGWTGDASLGIGIEAGRHDTQDNDFATGINQCINKDGSNAFTGNPNLGGFIPTNLGAGTAAAPALCVGGDTNTGVFGPAADTWAVATNGTERMRIDSTGRVGIGTTAPGFTVDIQSTSSNIISNRFSADTSPPQIVFRKSRGASVGTNTIVAANDSIGGIYFQGANGTGYTDAAGILGEIDGTPGASNDMPGRLRFFTTPDGSGTTTERMRIDSEGKVGIGLPPNPTVRLRLAGLGNTDSTISLQCTQSGGSSTFLVTDFGLLQAPYVWNKTNAAAANMYIDAAGTFWRSTSSLKYKENVTDLPYGLAKALQLRPVAFTSKNETSGKVYAGLIAEEVHDAGLTEFVVYNEHDEPDAVHYGNMVALAFKAIQELNAKIEALQARVAELEGA